MLRFSFKIKKDDGALRARLLQAQQFAANVVAKNVAETVKEKIPAGNGWYDIYRHAIVYSVEDGGRRWLIHGLWPTRFSTFPADTTLVKLSGDDPDYAAGRIVIQHNPWTIDTLPAIPDGYRLTALARPASAEAVGKERERLVGVLKDVKEHLGAAGFPVQDGEFPTISGTSYADIAFMAAALEHGLAGFPRVPHWVAAYRVACTSMGNWVGEQAARLAQILDGSEPFSLDAEGEAGRLGGQVGE